MRIADIQIGMRFGRLVVLEDNGTTGKGHRQFLCKCDCGRTRSTSADGLARGATVSCGCYRRERYWNWIAEKQRTRGDFERNVLDKVRAMLAEPDRE